MSVVRTSAAAVWGVVPASLRPTLDGRGKHHAVQAASAAAADGPSLAMERLCRRIRPTIHTVALRVYCACERRRCTGAVGAGNGDRGGARLPLPHVLAQERQQRRRQVGTLRQHCHARADPSGLGKGTITVHRRKEARSRCTVCATTFSARRGTMVYRKKTPVDILVPVVTLLAHGCPVSAMVAAFGLQAETVRTWAAESGVHCAQGHRHPVLGACLSLLHVQADEMRARMQKGMVWMAMALMVSARLWLGGVVSTHRDKDLMRRLADRGRACARPGALPVAVDVPAASVNAFRCALRRKAPWKVPDARTWRPGNRSSSSRRSSSTSAVVWGAWCAAWCRATKRSWMSCWPRRAGVRP